MTDICNCILCRRNGAFHGKEELTMDAKGMGAHGEKTYGSCKLNKDPKLDTPLPEGALFSSGFTSELRVVLSLAWPIILFTCFNQSLTFVSAMFCGHLGKDELAAFSLADTMLCVTGTLVCTGLTTACDTLFSQAYGGKKLATIGVNLQKSMMIVTLACVICWSVQLNVESLLILLRQDLNISRLAADYMLFFMPGLIFNFLYQVAVKYLQNQNMVIATALLAMGGTVFNAIAQYLLVYVCGYGLRGSAVGQVLTWLVLCLATFIYIIYSGALKQPYEGWSWLALENWKHFLKLGLSGYAMVLTEWGAFDLGIFIAGILGVVEQGAISVSLHIEMFGYMLYRGVGTVCSVRVGQNLGARNGQGAKISYRVSVLFAGASMLVLSLLMIFFSRPMALMFTDEADIINLVSESVPWVVLVMFSDAMMNIYADAFCGCGMQRLGAVIQVVGYCVLCVPSVVSLMLLTPAGVLGCWWGLLIGIVPMVVAYVIIMARLDWQKLAEKACSNTQNHSSIVKGAHTGLAESQGKSTIKDTADSSLQQITDSDIRRLVKVRSCACCVIMFILLLAVCTRVLVPYL